MGNSRQKEKKIKNRRKVDANSTKASVNYISVFILLAYGYVTVLTPDLRTFDSNGPKFLAMAILNIIVWCYFIYRENKNNSFSTFSNFFNTKVGLVYTILIVLALLSFVKSINVIESVVQLSKILTTFMATWILSVILLKDKRTIKYIVFGLAGLLVFDSLRVFYETYLYIQGDIETISLIKAGYSNKNILAASLFVKLPLGIWLLTFEKGWLKHFGLLSVFVGILAVLFMSSRSFYLGLITISALYSTFLVVRYYQTKNKIYLKDIGIYITSLIIAFLVFSAVQKNSYPEKADRYNKSFTDRLATLTVDGGGSEARLKFWGWSFDLIKENPVLGVGLGNWKIVILEKENQIKPHFSYMNKVHNDFIEISAERGILGGLMFISIFIFIFYFFLKSLIHDKSNEVIKFYFLPALGLLAYIFDAFFNFPHDRPQLQSLFALYVGMGIAFSFEFSNKEKLKYKVSLIKSGVKSRERWFWGLSTFILISTLFSGYILFLNYKSLKLQRLFKDEKTSSRKKTPSAFFISNYNPIPSLASTNDPINTLIANKLNEEGHYRKALSFIYSQNPSPFDSRHEFYLSFSYNKLNKFDSALYYIQQAYQLKPLYFVYTQHMCNVLESMNREDEAIAILDRFLVKTKNEQKAWKYGAALNFKLGDKNKAAQLMDSAFHYFPKDTAIIRLRDYYSIAYEMPNYSEAIEYYQAKDYKEAIKYFKLSESGFEKLGGYTRFPDFLNSWASSYLEINEVVSAKTIFRRVVEKDPKNYYALMNLGNIAFHKEENYSEATGYFTKCIDANSPNYFLSYKNLGTLYLIQEQTDNAIENYENALRYGSSKDVLGNLHLLWKSKGNQEKADYYKMLWNKE